MGVLVVLNDWFFKRWSSLKTTENRCSPWFYGALSDAVIMTSAIQAAADSEWSYFTYEGNIPISLPYVTLAMLWSSVGCICMIWICHLLRLAHIYPRFGSAVAHVLRCAIFIMEIIAVNFAWQVNHPSGEDLPLPLFTAAVGYIQAVIAIIACGISIPLHSIDLYFSCPHHYLTRVKKDMVLSTLASNLTFLIGAVIFEKIEGWTFDVALQYCIIFFLTIGYGNVFPQTSLGKIVSILYGSLGMLVTLNFLLAVRNLFVEWTELHFRPFIEKRVRRNVAERKEQKQMEQEEPFEAPVAVLDSSGHVTHILSETDEGAGPDEIEKAWGVDLGVIKTDGVDPDIFSEMIFPKDYQRRVSVAVDGRGGLERRWSEKELNILQPSVHFELPQTSETLQPTPQQTYQQTPQQVQRYPTLVEGDLNLTVPLPSKTVQPDETEDRMAKWRRNQRRMTRSRQRRVADYPGARRQMLRRTTWLLKDDAADLEEEVIHLWTDRIVAWIAFFVILIYWLVGAAIFVWLEQDWNYLDAVWFLFATISTVGFGDLVPSTPLSWTFWMYLTLMLCALWAFLLTVWGNIIARQNNMMFEWLSRYGDDQDTGWIEPETIDQLESELPFEKMN
jgi:hypothetical protein